MLKLTNELLLSCPCDDCPLSYSDCVYCKTCKAFDKWVLRLEDNRNELNETEPL